MFASSLAPVLAQFGRTLLWTHVTAYAMDTDAGQETLTKTITTIKGRFLQSSERLGRPGVGRDAQPNQMRIVFSSTQFPDNLPVSGDTITDGTKEYMVDSSESSDVAGVPMTVVVYVRGPR